MSSIILGAALLLFSLIAAWDATRITASLRLPGVFDLVGPDRYLLGVAVLIGGLGAGLLIQSFLTAGASSAPQIEDDEGPTSQRHFALIGALIVYAAAIPVLGYLISTFAFVIAAFRIMGLKDWRWILLSAAALVIGFYFAFERLADMALPAGVWDIG